MECRHDVHDAYNERVDAEHEQLVWRHPQVTAITTTIRPGHHEHAVEARRLLAHDPGAGARRLRRAPRLSVGDGWTARWRSSPAAVGFRARDRDALRGEGAGSWSSTSTRTAAGDRRRTRGGRRLGGRLVVGDVSTSTRRRQAVAATARRVRAARRAGEQRGIARARCATRGTWPRRSGTTCSRSTCGASSVLPGRDPAMLAAGGGAIVNVASIAATVCRRRCGLRGVEGRDRELHAPRRRASSRAAACGSTRCRPASCAHP